MLSVFLNNGGPDLRGFNPNTVEVPEQVKRDSFPDTNVSTIWSTYQILPVEFSGQIPPDKSELLSKIIIAIAAYFILKAFK